MKQNSRLIHVFLLAAILLFGFQLVHAQAGTTVTHVVIPDGTTVTGQTTPGNTSATGVVIPDGTTVTQGGGLTNPLKVATLDALITEILGYAIMLGGIFLTLMLVYVGFQFVMAQGNPEKVTAAKSMLLWTAIGGMLLLGAQAIALVITNTVSGL
jgi:hypothetical protein